MEGCDEVDVMTVSDIEDYIKASSNVDSVLNVVPKTGRPDYWRPSAYDDEPTVEITLPDINGIPPTDYELMAIKVKADDFETITVTVTDSERNVVFTVRC